ncbi:hypothetical protein IFM89_026377 [Coptis chinensis]|uniref:Rx N-terminal domain-containing protein n=1 Tax=Coptis chinensis TaxID=261450 RepID=A0A835M9M3_9MAGN|nr:hypothetical protein IFM89_026377 [Coptis chinensis]
MSNTMPQMSRQIDGGGHVRPIALSIITLFDNLQVFQRAKSLSSCKGSYSCPQNVAQCNCYIVLEDVPRNASNFDVTVLFLSSYKPIHALNRWGYYPLILIGSWAFGTINRIHDFIDPGHKIFWLSFLDVGMAALMGLFNSIAYGLNSSVRQAIHERLDLLALAFGNRASSLLVVFLITMAHAVISDVLEQLRSLLQTDQVNLLAGVRKESEKLNDTLVLIQGVLEDAEEKEVKNGAVKAWLEQLTRISYDADDVLDDWKAEIFNSQIQLLDDDNAPVSKKAPRRTNNRGIGTSGGLNRGSTKEKRKAPVLRFTMRDINERLDWIVQKKVLLELTERQSREEPRAVTSSLVDASEIYGRVDDTYSITLKLNGCDYLWKLPEGIGKLRNLRHLELKATSRLSYFPRGLGRLSCLRTLRRVRLDRDGGKGCQIGELKLLDHIQGKLRIEGLGQVADSIEAVLKKKEKLRSLDLRFSEERQAVLKKKEKLRSLDLRFSEERQDGAAGEENRKKIESVLDGLQPHTNLAVLAIEGYKGNKFPSWMMSSINSALPNLVKLKLRNCNQCSKLPALGRLQNLEDLELWGLGSVKRIGCEFYGLGSTYGTTTGGEYSVQSVVVFPKLHTLQIGYMRELEEWHLPFRRGVEIFPKVRTLSVINLVKLQMLPPGLGKLKSLEDLYLRRVKFRGLKLFQIDDNVTLSAQEEGGESVAVFPVLEKLTLYYIPEWEEQGDEIKLPIRRDEEGGEGFIMPCLQVLSISDCPKLKVVPHYLFSPALRSLKISKCPQLMGRQPCLPHLLEKLELLGDTGILSKSIISGIGSPDHNDTTNKDNDYPNLHVFSICNSTQSSLPQGFNQLTAIQSLEFRYCEFLDFTPEDLKHLPMLQRLEISGCPILEELCRKRESWTTNSHIPKIKLHYEDFIPE